MLFALDELFFALCNSDLPLLRSSEDDSIWDIWGELGHICDLGKESGYSKECRDEFKGKG
jgi:hypothetical protein